MSTYAALVCDVCRSAFMLGKVVYAESEREGHDEQVTEFWYGMAGEGRHNWQADDLNYSLFAFIAAHAGHTLGVMDEYSMDSRYRGQGLSSTPVPPQARFELANLTADPSDAYLMARGSERCVLGRPLRSEGRIVLFTGYFDSRDDAVRVRQIWDYLAQTYQQPLIVSGIGTETG